MRRWLRNATIRTKILVLVMSVTTVTVTLASASLYAWDYQQFRLDLMRELSGQAGLVIENSTAAMSFQDHRAALESLQTLTPNTHIQLGCLYDANGTLFSQFTPRGNNITCPPGPPTVTKVIGPDLIRVVEHSEVSGRPAGSIYLESDTTAVSARARVQAETAAVVLVVSLIVAFLLSTLFERLITAPVDALVRTARAVSNDGDYSLRATKTTADELGVLVDAFNGMLTHVEVAERQRGEMLEREREANRLKDEFLMTLSHELRTPLSAIQGWTNLLRAGAIPPDGAAAVLQKIERNVRTQARLLEDLLEISRFTAGKFRVERVPLDLIVIARHAIETVRSSTDPARLNIDQQFEIDTAPMVGDPDRLQQVIWNLLSNAVKFSPPSGRVTCTIRRRDSLYEVMVEDSGVGIAPAFLPHVFEPFRQADASTTRTHSGLGLGLAIAKRIVELHGGTIAAESAGPGHGATFTVRLPVADATAPLGGRAPRSEPAPADTAIDALIGARILVADDDADSREMIKTLLEAAGAQVAVAADASEAQRAAERNPPDVLISDIAMPGQDGFSLLETLRRRSNGTVPRVAIALTAHATAESHRRATDAGFLHHVAKPFDQRELVETIRLALRR